MRTTVTLDEDVAARVKRLAAERGVSFKEALNALLRAGLDDPSRRARRYRAPTRRLGARPGIDLDKALALAGSLEDREVARKIELRK
jgi:hypothetical protein